MFVGVASVDGPRTVNVRAALGSLGWGRHTLLPWAMLCSAGVLAGVASVRLAAVPRMPYEDFTWSFAVVMAIVSTAIPCTLLVDRVEVLSSTSARDLRPLRVVGFASASVLTQWPAVLLLVGAPRVLVVAVCAQSAGLLGLSAVVGRFDTRLVVVPTAVTVALALRVHLTLRESQVLACLGRGLSNREMAGELAVTESTVKLHLSSLMKKLGVATRVQALARAHGMGLT